MKKLSALPIDVTKTNISDVSNSSVLHCTSCTAKEVAVSRCCTCHNLLCTSCNTAHVLMRCFESHKVISLEDLRKDGKQIIVHKPLTCDTHPGENVVYYCNTCHTPACTDCAKDHNPSSGHQRDGILEFEIRVRQDLETLLTESKAKLEQLNKASGELNNSLEELAHQRSAARDLINETYQSYKAVLEKCRDDAIKELNQLHHERELKVMDMTEQVGKGINMLEDACKFTARLLENGTVTEIMYLRKIVGSQLFNLISNTPKKEKTYSIEFQSDFNEFEKVIKSAFGKFITENSKENHAPTNNLPPLTINGHGVSLTNGTSLTNSSPVSLPTSMQSSFDGDLAASLQGLTMAQSPPIPPVSGNALQGFSSMAEYNIAALASLAENSSTATSPSPPFTLAELLTNDTAYKNLASLAKLGFNSGNFDNHKNYLVHS